MTDPALDAFTPDEIDRAGRYHRPLYTAGAVGTALSLAVLVLLTFTSLGNRLFGLVGGLAWWASTPLYTSLILGISFVVGLPLAFWRGYVREKRWGFSTQSVRGWLVDRSKGLAVGLVLTGVVFMGLIGVARAFPRMWAVGAAGGAALLVLFLAFIAPVVLEPVFNRFRPLADAGLAEHVRDLSVRAGVPVREVLVADASRRTKKENAYVSGLGKTRRVVVYDTLLARADPADIGLVAAHELGHRRLRHVFVFTVLGMAGAVVAVAALWAAVQVSSIRSAAGFGAAADPRIVPFVMLLGGALEFVALPLQSALSRRWEGAADRFSLDLTQDADLFERTHHDLAVANLIDLAPPRLVYTLLFSHPTPPQRIAMARRWRSERATV
ncbi:MAG TPA: M48 family metallopeptidase [Actinomycetota bacterium]|nr:M48 family metallopeptidase [Actinomycetota bacterium]